ncbi:MAG: hypothetical protein WBD31_30715 [Rubripirellula sp.]
MDELPDSTNITGEQLDRTTDTGDVYLPQLNVQDDQASQRLDQPDTSDEKSVDRETGSYTVALNALTSNLPKSFRETIARKTQIDHPCVFVLRWTGCPHTDFDWMPPEGVESHILHNKNNGPGSKIPPAERVEILFVDQSSSVDLGQFRLNSRLTYSHRGSPIALDVQAMNSGGEHFAGSVDYWPGTRGSNRHQSLTPENVEIRLSNVGTDLPRESLIPIPNLP